MKTTLRVLCAALAWGASTIASAQMPAATDPETKAAVESYVYLYPLVVFGVSFEALTNVESPKWQTLSAPVNQFMSVQYDRPDNHGVILPSTDTLYTLAWVDATKEPVVFMAPDIPNIPGTTRKRFMMYEFMDAWTNVYYSDGLQKGHTKATNYILVAPGYKGVIPKIPHGQVVQMTTNQAWMIVRTQVEGEKDLPNVNAVQKLYGMRPLSQFGKADYVAPLGVVDPAIAVTPGPSPQANALDGKAFFAKASEWFNKVPFPAEDQAKGVAKALATVGIVKGQPFNYDALSPAQKTAMDKAVKGVQAEFDRIAANPASIGALTNGWTIPNIHIGDYGTDYVFRAAISFVGFGANLAHDGYYPLLVQDSKGKVLDGGKKYTITFAANQIPPAGAFWSVTNYQDHFLVPNAAKKYSVSSWMNPKKNSDGSITIYMQPTSPGAGKEINWLPTSATIPTPTPLMRLYWPLKPVFNGTWTPPPAVEVQ